MIYVLVGQTKLSLPNVRGYVTSSHQGSSAP